MCWRQVSKLQKTVLIVLFYCTVYILLTYAMKADSKYAFVDDDVRVGDKYALIFLARPRTPVYTDAEGAEVFQSRRCGRCFITNNRGFAPLSEYDAILVHGDKKLLHESSAYMYPEKRYLIETTSRWCMRSKLRECRWEPKITSFTDRKTYNLCTLCDHLQKQRRKDDQL